MPECYCCSEEATTVEHIPPKSFFAGREIISKRLISVPSCKKHNTKKSSEDEYFRNLVSMHENGSIESRLLFNKKTIKSFQDNPPKFSLFMEQVQTKNINNQMRMAFNVPRN